jgi:SurA-like N-terminal domain
MLSKLASLLLALLIALVAPSARAADVIDRVIATVNGHPILQSDWEEAISYEAFIDGRSLDKLTPEDRRATLDRLIDQELLREQVQSMPLPYENREQVEQRIQEIRKLYPGAETEQGWRATLTRYGLNEKELEARVATQIQLASFVDARLRPGIQVDSHSIEIYYRETLVPQLRKSGGKQVSLAEVSPQIKELLTQAKMNDLLASWLKNLRAESQIRSALAANSGGRAP